MLLIHAARVVDVRVDLAHVVEVTARHISTEAAWEGQFNGTDEERSSSPRAPVAR